MKKFALRFKDDSLQAKFIKFIDDAHNHQLIGVDSEHRNSLFIKARKVNFDLSRITEQCYTDDSALICLACMHCGIPEELFFFAGQCCDESNLVAVLMQTNQFNIIKDHYKNGDIFCNGKLIE